MPTKKEIEETETEITTMTISGLHYLSNEQQGQKCWIGRCILIDETTTRTLEKIIPITTSQPIPCKDYLHPRDPYFKNRSDICLFPSEKYTAKVHVHEDRYFIPTKVFESFVQQARASRPTKKMFNSRLSTRRRCLTAMVSLLSHVRRVRSSDRIPEDFQIREAYCHGGLHCRSLPWFFQISSSGIVWRAHYDANYYKNAMEHSKRRRDAK